MKKIFLLFIYIFVSFCLSAQKTTVKKTTSKTSNTKDFCVALKKVQADAYNNFEKIVSGEKSMLYDNNKKEVAYARRSILKIPGAMVNYIDETYNPNRKMFVAYFGTYTSEELAEKKMEIVKAQLSECLKDYELKDMSNPGVSIPVNWDYHEKRWDNMEKQWIQLEISADYKGKWIYKVVMNVWGMEKTAAPKTNETVSDEPNINTSPGFITGIDSSNLLSTDNKSQNRYYKELPITLKKGMGAVFYMEANAFKPYLILYSNGDGKSFGVPKITNENNGNRMSISFTTPAETTFYLIFSSHEENVTGKFYYGYSILDASQMTFSNDFSLCQKLGYLITQWQADWDLLPTSVEHHWDTKDPSSSYDCRVTNNTLLKGSNTVINSQYKEILFSSKDNLAVMEFYSKICDNIAACLGEDWESKSENIEERISSYFEEKRSYTVTHFFIKGAKGQPYKNFEVYRKQVGLNLLYEVQLVFN